MPATATKVRLRFSKSGDLRLVSHHDLMRCLERLLRRADLPVGRTQGFNPRPKVAFTLALALGVEGRREVVEIDLDEPIAPEEVLRRLAEQSPPGLDWLDAEAVAPTGRAAQAGSVRYALAVPPERREAAAAAVSGFLARESWPIVRRKDDRTTSIDLRPFVLSADLDGEGSLRLILKTTPGGSARPEEVLEALGLRDLPSAGAVLVRTDVDLAPSTHNAGPSSPAADATPQHAAHTPPAAPPDDHTDRDGPQPTPIKAIASERSTV